MSDTKKPLPKAYIFGAGAVGQAILPFVKTRYQVIAFLDNDSNKRCSDFEGLPVYDPKLILETNYDTDAIIVASQAGLESIIKQLTAMGVSRSSIVTEFVDYTVKSRIFFLESLSYLFNEENIQGSIAECGVFLGEFAGEINRLFPTYRLYLFDTFTGFDARDMTVEKENRYSEFGDKHFAITNEELVLSKMPHPDMCILRKGYFPETTEGLDEYFCFVNLDFDLYNPTLAGLEYFSPRMVGGGVILIHDYFCHPFKGVRAAVRDWMAKSIGHKLLPIGDRLSVAIQF
jgi:hypothetical protein